MEYTFKSDVKPKDLFKIAMTRIYKSYTCVINIVFTVAMIARECPHGRCMHERHPYGIGQQHR